MSKLVDISRFIALLLRHKPEVAGLSLDEHGWARVDELIVAVNQTHPINMQVLEEIVATDDKQRFAFNEDKTLIRASQGHSINVDVQLKQCIPPSVLYHGTAQKSLSRIKEEGLLAMTRLYVHLSKDKDTAKKVGSRHGECVIFKVDCEKMVQEGFKFFLSENQVWLTKAVPVRFLELIK